MARFIDRALPVTWFATGALAVGLAAGCHHCSLCQHEPVDMPLPNGTFVHKFIDAQSAKAEASDFVFFCDEWYQNGAQLGPHGMYHLNQVVRRLPETPFPIEVQPTADVALNELRRKTLVQMLLQRGIGDAEVRVVIAFSQAEGLHGEESERIYGQMLQPQGYINPSQYRNGGYGGNRLGIGIGVGVFGRP